ncbi:HAD-IB family hydrolase [Nitriliruptor alkaliphilus]|uniref:HAD-IB family hydrolase n=1 Tax=Nitriliruptor alkaliphilus TaxID=427918 RepID=UPI000696F933|nr:HAD-IB family hydrolase [Nitriliruptor alkaliphilus]
MWHGSGGSIAGHLDGRRVALTGVTGFVGQALLGRMLEELPGCRLVLLVRGSGGRSAQARVEDLLATAPAFARLREHRDRDAILAGIEVVDADLDADLPALPPIDALIHVAGTVSFDSRLDAAFRTHAVGLDTLYAAALEAGCEHLVHVSTAYVTALHAGPVPEAPVPITLDWRAEAAAADDLAARAESASRQPAALTRFLAEARRTTGSSGDLAVAEEAERVRRAWVDRQLVEAGRLRGRSMGFTDSYTFTKACGERVAEERFGSRRLSIVRPTIIESALRDPAPGWMEGFKVADPLIVGLGRGDIPEFPGIPDGVVDLVPVDLVANALIVALAHPPEPGSPRYVTSGTGARNPLTIHRMYSLVREAFERDPLPGQGGRGTPLPIWRFPGPDRLEKQLAIVTRVTRTASQLAARTPVTGTRLREISRTLGRHERRLATLSRFLELYGSYAQVESVFLDTEAQRLGDLLEGEDRERFDLDPRRIDWHEYLVDIHVPAVTAILRFPQAAPRPVPGPPPVIVDGDGGQVLAVFDLDGTVADTNVLTSYLRARKADSSVAFVTEAADILRALPRYLSLDATSRERFLRAFYQRFAGADVAALRALVDDDLSDRILHDLKPAAVRRIREHREQGHRTILITGALAAFCTPLRTLFDTIVAADLEVDEQGRATGHLATPPLVGAGRAAWLTWHAAETGADLARSFAYADSRSDLPMLRCVGHPVAVDPDAALHREARRQRWAIATWSSSAQTPVARRPVGIR